jgi:hypothetical protein
MSDTATEAPAQVPPSNDTTMDAREALDSLRDLFATLVPPERLTLTDAYGNAYTARAVLPARAQIKVMQQLHALWERDVPAITGQDAAGVAGLLVALAADAEVLDGLADAFEAAHPSVCAQARKAAEAEGARPADVAHAADLFPVEELVAGLIPFFVRFASRAASLMGEMTARAS